MKKTLFEYHKYSYQKYSFSGEKEWATLEWATGLLFQPNAFWIGAHYSYANNRLCINILPMLTLWITFREGNIP